MILKLTITLAHDKAEDAVFALISLADYISKHGLPEVDMPMLDIAVPYETRYILATEG